MPSPVSGTCEEETGKLTFPLPNSHTCRHTPAFSSNLIAFFQKWPHWLVVPHKANLSLWLEDGLDLSNGLLRAIFEMLIIWPKKCLELWSFPGTGVCFCFYFNKTKRKPDFLSFPCTAHHCGPEFGAIGSKALMPPGILVPLPLILRTLCLCMRKRQSLRHPEKTFRLGESVGRIGNLGSWMWQPEVRAGKTVWVPAPGSCLCGLFI